MTIENKLSIVSALFVCAGVLYGLSHKKVREAPREYQQITAEEGTYHHYTETERMQAP